ncbi:hypothetical protein [Vreelandella indica]|uniref:hypothetical protein n=1 Tax=Vreelandella indica TaxID=3126500 RepID=UPI00300E0340
MTGTQKLICYIAIITALSGGYFVHKHFDYEAQALKSNAAVQQQTIQMEGQKHAIDALLEQNKQALSALQSQGEAGERVSGAVNRISEGYDNIVRSVPDAERIDIGDATLDSSDISQHIENLRPDTYPEIIDKDLFIEQVNRRSFPRISIRVMDLDDNAFTLHFNYGDISPASYDAIFDAIKNNNSVSIKYNAMMRDGGIFQKGTVLNVEKGASNAAHNINTLDFDEDEDEDVSE